jgi:hypothetical protein
VTALAVFGVAAGLAGLLAFFQAWVVTVSPVETIPGE